MKHIPFILVLVGMIGCNTSPAPRDDQRFGLDRFEEILSNHPPYRILSDPRLYERTMSPGWLLMYGEQNQRDGELCVFIAESGLVEVFVNRTPGVAHIESNKPTTDREARLIGEKYLRARGADLKRNPPLFERSFRVLYEPMITNTGRASHFIAFYTSPLGPAYTADPGFFPRWPSKE